MFIRKSFTDQYGNSGPKDLELVLVEISSNGHNEARVCFSAYASEEAKNNGYKKVDYFEGVLNGGIFSCTDNEMMEEDGETLGQKLKSAFLKKAMASIMSEPDENEETHETNLFSGNIGEIGFQDAIIL